ncbi:hypothetical protein K438DRAFT_652748 [Mycena galopus ATCC 62051]|nr:hypothetical protein K438DRAFT_652748 [Mycena galopus ATCC 62051]
MLMLPVSCPAPIVVDEQFDGGKHEAESDGVELLGLLAIIDRSPSIDGPLALSVKVKIVTCERLAITKETVEFYPRLQRCSGTQGRPHRRQARQP